MPATWNLFLSSTVKDLKAYRLAVQEACLSKAGTTCLLSEQDWVGGYDDTVALCKLKVQSADAFVLILGYWYGSVPPGADRSITHIEFDEARQKWPDKFPPMAVMSPAPRSEADRLLRQAARTLLKKRKNAAELQRSVTKFRQTVSGEWRTVTPFTDEGDLREHVIAKCLTWKGRTPLAAARGEIEVRSTPAAASQVTDEQLGAIGRDAQALVVKSAMAKLADHPAVPALALFVHGGDDAGQRAFAQRLTSVALKNSYPRQRIARLPVGVEDPAALSGWIGRSLGLADLAGVQTPEQLAARVAIELKRRPLHFGLDRVGDLMGGVAAFRDGFWVPFYRQLHRLRATQQLTHRLVAVITGYAVDPDALDTATAVPTESGEIADYSRLLQVPRLEPFTRDQLLAWFDDVDIPDEPAGRRKLLANRALNDSQGHNAPSPLLVFERLRGETLWPEGDPE